MLRNADIKIGKNVTVKTRALKKVMCSTELLVIFTFLEKFHPKTKLKWNILS